MCASSLQLQCVIAAAQLLGVESLATVRPAYFKVDCQENVSNNQMEETAWRKDSFADRSEKNKRLHVPYKHLPEDSSMFVRHLSAPPLCLPASPRN